MKIRQKFILSILFVLLTLLLFLFLYYSGLFFINKVNNIKNLIDSVKNKILLMNFELNNVITKPESILVLYNNIDKSRNE